MKYRPERRGFVHARFEDAIVASRYSPEQVALGSGLSIQTIYSWANGKHVPQISKLARVAQFLGVDPDVFYDRDDE